MREFRQSIGVACVACLSFLAALAAQPASADWRPQLAADIKALDAEMTGRLGVFIHHLGEDRYLAQHSERDWYLSSTVKVPLAIAVLQRVEDGALSLDDTLVLADSDYVDGAGDLLLHEPGHRFTIKQLLEKSIRMSDSTATDMLIRLLGEASFNHQIERRMISSGFGRITTILQVRYDAYDEVHPNARNLSNRDFIDLKTVSTDEERYAMLLEKLGIDSDAAGARSNREAFERYYERGLNSATLQAYGHLLARLVRGELLDQEHTALLLDYMEDITTGDNRIAAGLPRRTAFAHKTGTQVARACDIGVLNPRDATSAVIVAACAEAFGALSEAEDAFRQLGRALTAAGLTVPRQP